MQHGKRLAQPLSRAAQNAKRDRIPRLRRNAHIARGQPAAARQLRLQHARASALFRLLHHADRELRNATTAGPAFNRSRLVVADWTRRAKPHVTYLARIAIRPQVQTAGGDDARTQARCPG